MTINKAAIVIKKERNIKETLLSLRLNKIYIPKNPNKTTVLIFMKLAIARKKTALLYSSLIINFISYKKGYITYELFKRIQKTLVSIYENLKLPDIDKLIIALKKDKKNISNKLNCVLTKGPGNMFLEEVEYSIIQTYLKEYNEKR